MGMEKTDRIFLAGHDGLVGSAIHRRLQQEGYQRIITTSFKELDLRRQEATEDFFAGDRPDYVFLAAAKVGGIVANNTYPAEFIYDNLMIEANIIAAAQQTGTKKLLFLGSSCIYPKFAPQPMTEDCLLTGVLEPTNEPYAIAKIAGIKMCQAYRRQYGSNFISVMPTNLYGPGDNFDLETSHVVPAMLRKFHEAKTRGDRTVTLWGTGAPHREFLHVDDLADACVFLMKRYDEPEIINIGVGKDVSIRELAAMIQKIVDFKGEIIWDTTKPDGTPRKLLDVDRLSRLGWQAGISLEEGLEQTYRWYCENRTDYN
jgi:GDP-L-fucose synthase